MTSRKTQAYGTWLSPISAEMLASSAVSLGQTFIDFDNVYWLETRPAEKGRSVLVGVSLSGLSKDERGNNLEPQRQDITSSEFNVRTSVHEYGGGAALIAGGNVYFSHFADHRVFKHNLESKQVSPLSKEGPSRFADFCLDERRNRLILVREDHSEPGLEALNSLDVLSLNGPSEPETLLTGSDFFSSPRLSPDGRLLAWLTWNHPNMPWDESKLWTANVGNDGSLSNIQQIAGGQGVSIAQPEWGPDNTLYFVSDHDGWWNLSASYSGLVEPLLEMEAEFAVPQWIFGLSNYAVYSNDRLICSYCQSGVWRLAEYDAANRKLTEIETTYQDIRFVRLAGDKVVFRGGAPDRFAEIVLLDLRTRETTVLRRSNDCKLDSQYFSKAEPIEFPSRGGGKAHAFFYPAHNPDYSAPEGSLPPLIVLSHGGPTFATTSTLNLEIQYWTTRGFSVVDVNYGGSSGYGRAYRERLNGTWGVVDVDDCVSAVNYLVENGRVDRARVAISGGSAGGFTTLCALAFSGSGFAAGASYYGVSDPTGLAQDTHKFESRYLDRLIGPYPDARALYEERSPLVHADRISCPVIFFQGLDDKVVPPSQSESMVNALKKKGLPVAYLTFSGEQHGFRQANTIKTCLDSELAFFCRVFAIERDDIDGSLTIENADRLPALKARSAAC
jgi:dipeptidyl aminopeptidase/acylaminoacyl peptidase